jgi:hypothetical protein
MEQLYHRFFNALPIHRIHADEDLHLLSPEELYLVRRTERWAMAGAVLVELVAYLCIFLPIYAFPGVFGSFELALGWPFSGVAFDQPWFRYLWMLVLTLFELYVLLLLNLAAVHGIAVATGYIRRDTKAANTRGLIDIALERRFKEQARFGIDPYEGVNPWVISGLLVFNRLQGLIGSALLKAALSNLFGREIFRVALDFSGMPIYMAINVLTTRAILRHARVVMMGRTSIDIVRGQMPKLRLTDWEKGLVYDTLQFIAVNKRDFHANHYYLTHAILEHFDIPPEPAHPLPGDYLEKLRRASWEVGDICRLIIILGFILDGRLSGREHRQIDRLHALGVLESDFGDLERYCRDFVEGQGLAEITRRLLHRLPPAGS